MKYFYLFITWCVIGVSPSFAQDNSISDIMKYDSKTVNVLGSNMHYVEGGQSGGDVFLFLHGNPSSSYLWRNVMPHLEPLGRVIAVDLIGMGQSDKPKLKYTFQDHSRYINAFISKLKLKDVTLVIHDWGSVLGLEYARTHQRNVKAIAMMEAIIPPRFPMTGYEGFGAGANIMKAFRDPVKGRAMVIDQNMFIERILLNGAITRKLNETEKTAYRAPFLNAADREPILMWPNELPVDGRPARNVKVINKIGDWLKTSKIPKLVLWASPGSLITEKEASWMQENYRNLEAVYIGRGLHFIQEDQPEAIGRNINIWHQRTFN